MARLVESPTATIQTPHPHPPQRLEPRAFGARSSPLCFFSNSRTAYTYTLRLSVKFQRRSSINVRLTEGSLYKIGFTLKGFWGDAKIFSGKVHSSSELRVFRHLWSRSDVRSGPKMS